jgi:hypothetical protein
MRKLGRMAPLIVGVASIAGVSCKEELTLDPPVKPDEVVVAQFDPTHPIPVLQIVPSPTALAEKPGGGLAVTPLPCEGASAKTCLGLFDKWPTSTPITLYFSGPIDESTIPDGIKLVKASAIGSPIPYDFVVSDRPPPPEECFMGGNGANPDRPFAAADLPPGIQVVLTPKDALEPASLYMVYVESDDMGGLRSADGKRVEPSNLFALLNVDATMSPPPVEQDGTLNNGLLRVQVQAAVLAALFPNKELKDLTSAERMALDAAVKEQGRSLFGLYGFFDQTINALVAAQATTRDKLVFANSWNTSAAPAAPKVQVGFDLLAQVFPFPNMELMTATTGMGLGDVRVNLPINPCPGAPMPGCDSPTAAALLGGLNTLNGFSTTAPIVVPFTGNIDPASLEGNVLMFALNDQGMIEGGAVEVQTSTVTGDDGESVLLIRPRRPLDQNKVYALALKRGIKDTEGGFVGRPDIYNILTSEQPLVTGGMVNPAATVPFGGGTAPVATLLQCSELQTTGKVLNAGEVLANAQALEFQAMRPRWQVALTALAGANPPVAENDVLIAWTYKTQDITGLVDQVKLQLLPQVWEQVRTSSGTPRIIGPIAQANGRAQISAFMDIPTNFCLPACQGGLMATGQFGPVIAPDMCTNPNGTVTSSVSNHPACGFFTDLLISRIGSLRVYALALYDATEGNPFTAGTFTRARITRPEVVQTRIFVAVPTNTTTTAPAKIAMFQHAIGGMAEHGFLIMNSLAQAGFATVMMDLPFHGSRASDLVNNMSGQPCPGLDPELIACDPRTHACVGGCDGMQDMSATGFASANLFSTRDNLRQATIDHLTLLRALQEETGAGEPLAFLDETNIGYVGQSMGGITGGNFAAFAPELSAVVLNVAGGGIMELFLASIPQISAPLFAALAATGTCELNTPNVPSSGCKESKAYRQFRIVGQTAIDPGDPLATSIGVIRAHNGIPPIGADNVLMQMAQPDRVVRNFTSVRLGEAYGLDPSDNGSMSHFQTFAFPAGQDCHAFLIDISGAGCTASPIEAVCSALGAQAQAARFLASGGAAVGDRTVTVPLLCP